VIDDENVKWNILDLHEFEPELFLECAKNIWQAPAEVIRGASFTFGFRLVLRHRESRH
jgi:hypothetical protein